VVNQYGRQLLWSQAIAANETPSNALIQAKQATYTGIANSLQQNDPAVYPLFQGNQWTTRLEIAFAAVFAALVAGLLILLIALTLIVLKLGFLLLLVAGPFFLIVGTHPGFGRVIAIRWFEMLVGVLMKQVAVAVVLSVLLYCYSLIMGTSDAVLPWALKILMIALVTVAVFIYRKPFQHLFSAVGYGTIGSQERAEYSLREAGSTFRRSTLDAATVAVPGVAGYRAARWARRNPGQAAALAAGVASRRWLLASPRGARPRPRPRPGPARWQSASSDAYASRLRPDAPPPADGEGEGEASPRAPAGWSAVPAPSAPCGTGSMPEAATGGGGGRVAPPLDLPPQIRRVATARGGRDFRDRRSGQVGVRLVSRRRALGRRRARGRAYPGGVRRIPRTFGVLSRRRTAGLGAAGKRRRFPLGGPGLALERMARGERAAAIGRGAEAEPGDSGAGRASR
jgi:hypothetical protein